MNENITAAGTDFIFDGLKRKLGVSSLGDFFKDLLKEDRFIRTVKTTKDAEGALNLDLEMSIGEDDDKPSLVFPAKIKLSKVDPNDKTKINLEVNLPSKDYATDKKLVRADGNEHNNIANSKKEVERACWNCFDDMKYDMEEFSKSFAVDENMFDFGEEDKGFDDVYDASSKTYQLSFLYTPEESDQQEQLEVFFKVKVTPIDRSKQKVNLSFQYPNPDNVEGKDLLVSKNAYTSIKNNTSDILDCCQEFVDKMYKVDTLEEIPSDLTASSYLDKRCIQASLRKIKNKDSYSIRLQNISANYTPSEALSDINQLINSIEFVDSLPEDEVVELDIISDDKNFTIDEVDTVYDMWSLDCKKRTYDAILDSAYKFYFDCQYCGFTACGPQMSNIQSYAQNYEWKINEIIDAISQMTIEDKIQLIHPITRIQGLECCGNTPAVTWTNFIDMMKQDIQDLIDCMKLYMNNLEEDKQVSILNWIRTWNTELNYSLANAGC